jgi:hypothetical protein
VLYCSEQCTEVKKGTKQSGKKHAFFFSRLTAPDHWTRHYSKQDYSKVYHY